MKHKLFRLTSNYKNLKTGNLMLEGDVNTNDEIDEKGIEYFDMTFEIANGWGVSYSYYAIPAELLGEAYPEDYAAVDKHFKDAGFKD